MNAEKRIQRLAAKNGYRILSIHDGLYDYQDLGSGIVYRASPEADTLQHLSWYERKAMLADAKARHANFELYDTVGSFKTPGLGGGRCCHTVLLQRKKTPGGPQWAVKGADGTRSFYDFHSAATFLCGVYGRKRPLTPGQYSTVIAAYREHLSSGEPFVMPEV